MALKLSHYCTTADDHWICLRIYPSGNKCLPQVGASGAVLLSVRVVRAAVAHMKSTFSVCSALSGSEWRSPRSCAAQVCLDYSNLTLVPVASRRCAHGCPVAWMYLRARQLQVKSESVRACERGFWKLNMNRGQGIRMLWNLEDLLVNGNYNVGTRHSFTAYYSLFHFLHSWCRTLASVVEQCVYMCNYTSFYDFACAYVQLCTNIWDHTENLELNLDINKVAKSDFIKK